MLGFLHFQPNLFFFNPAIFKVYIWRNSNSKPFLFLILEKFWPKKCKVVITHNALPVTAPQLFKDCENNICCRAFRTSCYYDNHGTIHILCVSPLIKCVTLGHNCISMQYMKTALCIQGRLIAVIENVWKNGRLFVCIGTLFQEIWHHKITKTRSKKLTFKYGWQPKLTTVPKTVQLDRHAMHLNYQ